jgi:membrane dipeptidase
MSGSRAHTRRRFLQHGLLAAAGLSLLPAADAGGAPADDRHIAPADGVRFDLHAHPGAFMARGTPDYAGDAAFSARIADMRDGGLTGAFFSLVADAPLLERTPTGIVVRGAYAPGDGQREYERQLAALRALLAGTPAFIATTASDLLRAQRERTVAAFVACEGGEFLEGNPDRVDELHAGGVRSLQLVHYAPSILGDLQTQPAQHGGLSALGKAVVKRANAVRIVLDVAHAAFDTARDVVALTTAPIILSHSILKIDDRRPLAARAITVEHAKLVAGTGGVIGAWPSGFNTSFDEFVDNTRRLIDTVGIDHVGLGTDMDGNFKPVLSTYGQLAGWQTALRAKGLSADDVVKVMGGNLQRVLRQVLG